MRIPQELTKEFIGPIHPAWSIVKRECLGCAVAFNCALNLIEDVNDGTRSFVDAEREQDIRLGTRCVTGATVIGSEVLCIIEPVPALAR